MKQSIANVNKWNYGDYSSGNYGAHSMAIELGARTVYFSYDTVVAFRGKNSNGEFFNCVHSNDWGTTTGKHLNFIDGGSKEARSKRLNDEDFNKQLKEFLK